MQTNSRRMAAFMFLLGLSGATASARASQFEFCELHGRIASEPVAESDPRRVSLSLQVERVKERRMDRTVSYIDCTYYVGRSETLSLKASDLFGRPFHVGDALGVNRTVIDSSDGVSNVDTTILHWKSATR